jgi:hypothetical protein
MGAKIFLGLFATAVTLTLATVGSVAAVVYGSGTVSVEVQPEDGSHLSLGVPAALAYLAVALTPDELLADFHREMEPVWPTVEAAAQEMDDWPDFVLLEARSRDEYVRIAKQDGKMVIEVVSRDERVRVAIPTGAVRRVVRKLGKQSNPTAG